MTQYNDYVVMTQYNDFIIMTQYNDCVIMTQYNDYVIMTQYNDYVIMTLYNDYLDNQCRCSNVPTVRTDHIRYNINACRDQYYQLLRIWW